MTNTMHKASSECERSHSALLYCWHPQPSSARTLGRPAPLPSRTQPMLLRPTHRQQAALGHVLLPPNLAVFVETRFAFLTLPFSPRATQVEVESIVQEHKATVAKVQDAVQSALAAAKQPGTAPAGAGPAKRSAAGSSAAPPAKQPPAKRARGMMAALEPLGSESESSEEEEEGGDA